MNVDVGDKRILELLLGDARPLSRYDDQVIRQLYRTVNLILSAESIDDLRAFKSTGYKFYGGFHQVNVGGDYRLWFTLESDGTVLLREFDEGNH